MKGLLFSLAFLAVSFTAHADSYAFLTFETTEAKKVSVPTSSLTFTISGATLKAGKQSFILTNLSKMYFTTSDMTTGINAINITENDKDLEVYDLNGRKMNGNQLPKGVYVVKSKRGTCKMIAK